MELLEPNLVNTTTQITVGSNTALAANLFNPDRVLQYFTDGFASDATTASVTIAFDATQTISRIALLEHNLESFNLYYNGATANTIAITGPTTVANFVSNAASDLFLQLSTPINCTSLTLDLRTTITANAEKAIGLLVLTAVELDFARIPNASGYVPSLDPKQITHTLSDGGVRVHSVRDKWKAKVKLGNITEDFRDDLRAVYDQHSPFIFVPFGTYTGWDGILFESVWVGAFDFYRFSDNAPDVGFSGTIDLRETAS